MGKALILVKTSAAVNTTLFKKIKSLSGVVEANMIYGPYDVYTLCEDGTTMGIKRLVLDIRNLPGVVATMTCLISE
jgi:nitrate reductase NapAB chaperone NapD